MTEYGDGLESIASAGNTFGSDDMKVKTKRKICAAIALIAFFFVYGTAGASDLDAIPMKQIIWQLIVGNAVMLAALYKGGYLQE